MKTQLKRSSGKYINLILLCLFFTFGSACEQKTDNEPTPPDGDGNGVFEFEEYSTIPTSFNCNTSGSFTFYLQPVINDDWDGFNRLHFELEKAGAIYRSNYVEFSSADESVQLLEWGGSLPTGEYQMTGILENIQLNSTCANKICNYFHKSLGNIVITEFSNPQKVMEIEYFCQDSDTNAIDRYDVFLSPNTEEYIDIAFNIANTRDNVITYDTDLDPEVIEYDPYDPREIKQYIFNLKQWEDEMFLCGVKAFKDPAGNLIPDLLGVTYEDDTLGRVPTCSTGSLVAVKTCIDFAAEFEEYILDYNDLVTAMTIHELGLQRGANWQEHVPTRPYPKFCIGHRALIVYLHEQYKHPYWAVRYSNPHFCDECIAGIKNISW
jgi:hypothetical protein